MHTVTGVSPIKKIVISATSKDIAVLSADGVAKLYDPAFRLVKSINTNIDHSYSYRNTFTMTNDLSKLLFVHNDSNKIQVIEFATRKTIYEIQDVISTIEILYISPNDKYMAVGCKNGKVYIYALETGTLLCDLKKHNDHIAAIAISKDNQYAATVSVDGQLFINKLSNNTCSVYSLTLNDVCSLHFLNNKYVLCADKHGEIIIIDIERQGIVKKFPIIDKYISSVKIDISNKFLLIGTLKGNLYICNIHGKEHSAEQFQTYNSAITEIAMFPEGNLCVGLTNGLVHKTSLHVRLNHKAEPSKESQVTESVQKDNILQKSSKEKREEPAATRVNAQAEDLISSEQKSIMGRFKKHVELKQYHLAYALAAQNTILLKTDDYKLMEKEWEEALKTAMKILIQNNPNDDLEELFKNFRGVPSKTRQIKDIVGVKSLYSLLNYHIRKENYQSAFNLIEIHPELQQTEGYQKLRSIGEVHYKKLLSNINIMKDSDIEESLDFVKKIYLYDAAINKIVKQREMLNKGQKADANTKTF